MVAEVAQDFALAVAGVAQDFALAVPVAVAVVVRQMWMFELMILVFQQPLEKSQKIVTKEEEPKNDSDFLVEVHHRI